MASEILYPDIGVDTIARIVEYRLSALRSVALKRSVPVRLYIRTSKGLLNGEVYSTGADKAYTFSAFGS